MVFRVDGDPHGFFSEGPQFTLSEERLHTHSRLRRASHVFPRLWKGLSYVPCSAMAVPPKVAAIAAVFCCSLMPMWLSSRGICCSDAKSLAFPGRVLPMEIGG